MTKAESARVQVAHYFGYFIMSIPAGWLATKLGYKGGIIAGLLIVATGFARVPDIKINAAFLQGWLSGWFQTGSAGHLAISNKGASNLASLGFVCFLVGRFTGALLLKRLWVAPFFPS